MLWFTMLCLLIVLWWIDSLVLEAWSSRFDSSPEPFFEIEEASAWKDTTSELGCNTLIFYSSFLLTSAIPALPSHLGKIARRLVLWIDSPSQHHFLKPSACSFTHRLQNVDFFQQEWTGTLWKQDGVQIRRCRESVKAGYITKDRILVSTINPGPTSKGLVLDKSVN